MSNFTHCPHCGKPLEPASQPDLPANPDDIQPPFYALEIPPHSGMYFDDKGFGGAFGLATAGTNNPMLAKRYADQAAAEKAGLRHFSGWDEGYRAILVTGE